ncbi:alpha/beta fold hydrolase [Paenibacillus chitinolyticus]|uniref:alpha/beta fold hydrolase n=1 Tax=Paenibacillus chitinolyticus TaxID=79263 RepID=UPI0036313953
MFRDLIERLSDPFHIFAPDYPGFGYSDAPSTETFAYTFDRLDDIVEKFTVKLSLENYALYMQDSDGSVGFRLVANIRRMYLFSSYRTPMSMKED